MREIKFRTWYPEGKKIITPTESYGGDVFIRLNGEKVICMDTEEWEEGLSVDFGKDNLGLILMQFTGLKDMNGKEIYEGDILRYTKSKSKGQGQKRKEEYHYWAVSFQRGEWVCTRGEITKRVFDTTFNHEVCGNIYENPNLITT